jgi:hypothetical protein
MAINAVLAIIADGGRAIVVIYAEGEEINYFLLYFIDSDKTLMLTQISNCMVQAWVAHFVTPLKCTLRRTSRTDES